MKPNKLEILAISIILMIMVVAILSPSIYAIANPPDMSACLIPPEPTWKSERLNLCWLTCPVIDSFEYATMAWDDRPEYGTISMLAMGEGCEQELAELDCLLPPCSPNYVNKLEDYLDD